MARQRGQRETVWALTHSLTIPIASGAVLRLCEDQQAVVAPFFVVLSHLAAEKYDVA